MKRILSSVAGVAGMLVGLGLILPAVALWRQNSPATGGIVGPLILGGALMLGGGVALARGGRRAQS